MAEHFIDILCANGKLESCKIVLLTVGHPGASPTIERMSAEHFFIKLRTVLNWPEETTDHIREKLEKHGKAVNESLGSPTIEQLRRLGFQGVE
jgi:hypothetical protein